MAVELRSRAEQVQLSADLREEARLLRAQGSTWVAIAAIMRAKYGVTVRAALRLAHGWTQSEAAAAWNERWPDDPKTFKNFSYWEVWPARTGYAPSLEVLARLAELYECSIADLVADGPDHRGLDEVYQTSQELQYLPAVLEVDGASTGHANGHAPDGLAGFVARVTELNVNELARITATWGQQITSDVTRRAMLHKLSLVFGLAASTPVMDWVDAAELPEDPGGGSEPDLAGIWLSRYTYFSTGRNQAFSDEHYVVLEPQDGGRLAGRSLPHTTGSVLSLELAVKRSVATGTWTERTSPTGYYRGAVYDGAIHLLIDPLGRRMTGKWLGFGKDGQIDVGEWELLWMEGSTSPAARRKYDLKL